VRVCGYGAKKARNPKRNIKEKVKYAHCGKEYMKKGVSNEIQE